MSAKMIRFASLIFVIILLVELNLGASSLREIPTVRVDEIDNIREVPSIATAKFSGRVYEGPLGDESKPLANVMVELYCSSDSNNLGRRVGFATTDAKGWYELSSAAGCEFYNIKAANPEGYVSVGATTVGGKLIGSDRIQYAHPIGRSVLTGNKFWLKGLNLALPMRPITPLVPMKPPEPETVSCPEGCECIEEEIAAEKFGKYEWCSDEICGFGEGRVPKYCFRPAEPTTEICPDGCECIEEKVARERFGKYEWCSDEMCGVSENGVPKYCFRPIEPTTEICPEGCECMEEEVAKERFGKYEWCSDEMCGVSEDGVPKYCFRPIEPTTEICPEGCECIEEEVAKERFGKYKWCSDEICGFGEGQVPKYCFRPAEPTQEIDPESCNLFISTEEDFVTQGPLPPDGNPLISDGDLLGPGCIMFARNRELLEVFKIEIDLGLDAVDVIDEERRLIVFSTELNDPLGRFTAGDLLATNGAQIPNSVLLSNFDVRRGDLGLDAVHFIGDLDNIVSFLAQASEVGRGEWLKNQRMLSQMLEEHDVDIWLSTEGTPFGAKEHPFFDGDLLSARDGIIVASNALLFTPTVPAGLPDRGVDFGLDATTSDRYGNRQLIHFSTEIHYEGDLDFSDGDVLLLGDGVICTNKDLISCFEPGTCELGLDALSIAMG